MAVGICSVALASSPSGMPPKNSREAFVRADVVFIGRVEQVFKDSHGYDSAAEVEVQKIWKGKELLFHRVKVDGKGGPTSPARIYKLHETYLFYLPVIEKGRLFRADVFLHRVVPKAEASDDLSYLSNTHER
jgi:hypothetical protein